ncbi:MAG TPA: DNA cytosine methyltransferase [Pyrinomonadaceae bacterium]
MIEIVVDNFAGGGGASHGIERAIGRAVDYAINHDAEAIAMHKANHPNTEHLTENVWQVDPASLLKGRAISFGWFSPDCTFHSKARGGKPFRDRDTARRIRGLAWIVIKWAKLPVWQRPRIIFLENVEEFQDWGPLLDDGTPCPLRKGLTFRRWWKQLENLGYRVEMRELRACDYGAPTSRKRLFIIARCDGQPIRWPAAMFGPALQPYRTAAECVDWSIPVPSIFLTKQEAIAWGKYYGVRPPKRPLVDASLRRIARGTFRYVINNPRPFIVPLTHQGSDRVHSIDEPFRTITSAHRGELALVTPFLTEFANASHQRNFRADEPMRTQCAQVKGGHFALVSAFLARHYGGHENDGQSLDRSLHTITTKDHHALITAHIQRDFSASVGHAADEPLASITAGGNGHAALAACHIVKFKGTSRHGQQMDLPLHTVQSGGHHYGQVYAFLQKYYGTEQNPKLGLPLDTITTKDRFALVTVHGEKWAIGDIGMRLFSSRELFRAQGFPDSYVIDPWVTKTLENGKEIVYQLSKTAQIRMCGNSVPPPVAEALVKANYVELVSERAA